MDNITIGRYEHESVTRSYLGWIEPDDKSWIIFIRADGTPEMFADRDPVTGAVK